jgi:hypothetical protein
LSFLKQENLAQRLKRTIGPVLNNSNALNAAEVVLATSPTGIVATTSRLRMIYISDPKASHSHVLRMRQVSWRGLKLRRAVLLASLAACAVALLLFEKSKWRKQDARSQERKGAPPSFRRYVTMPELLVPVKRLAPMSMNPKRSDILWSRPCGFDVACDSLLNYEVLRLAEFVF